ncbi:MAG TPA: hypothetical protein PKA09_24315 [Geminicoccus sp.]|nr:hypothetical protein [Geminicoccus sp.]
MPELAGYFRTHRIAAACLVLVTMLMMGLRTLNLPYSAPWADQAQFLGYAYNMAKYATFSVTRRDRPRPDQMREPGYPVVLAAGLLLHPGIDLDKANAPCVTEGVDDCLAPVTWLKLVNVLFLGLSAIAVFATLLALTGNPLLAWIGHLWVLLSASYAHWASMFFAEVVVGFLMVALSLRLWRLAGQSPDRRYWFLTGLLLGALVMVKATFYYLAPLLAVFLAVLVAARRAATLRESAILGALFLAGTLALTLPWQARNLVSTGTASLTGRSGIVLYARASYDALSFEEHMAAAALFSPSNSIPERYLSQRWLTPELKEMLTGSDNPRDRAFARAGELRDQTKFGTLSPEVDAILKKEALHHMIEHWRGHLRATLVFGWRGLFGERGLGFVRAGDGSSTIGQEAFGLNLGRWILSYPVTATVALFLPAFLAFFFCVATGRWPYVLLMVPAAYLYALQALMTHYIPRYSAPLIPMLIVISLVTLAAVLGWLGGRLSNLLGRPSIEAESRG